MGKCTIRMVMLSLFIFVVSCASTPPEHQNTHKGALIGAGAGAFIGQALGRNTHSTLAGIAAGTILGALVGNAMDQENAAAAAEDAALYDKKVIHYDEHGSAIEAIPDESDQRTHCRKVTKRTWKNGELVSETIEEICEGKKRSKEY
ncbi:MAG: glycine zipper 2TM domain-containing protein [Deltaproteobacteria bacterium]|nr:glycine zipper 2TM domain-containing protein [Deltaproteobacteria bacterium]